MKVKTNIRAGKQSGTVLSNSDLSISGRDPNRPPSSDDTVPPVLAPVGDIRHPGIVRSGYRELTIQQVLLNGNLRFESVVALNLRFCLQRMPSFQRIRVIR